MIKAVTMFLFLLVWAIQASAVDTVSVYIHHLTGVLTCHPDEQIRPNTDSDGGGLQPAISYYADGRIMLRCIEDFRRVVPREENTLIIGMYEGFLRRLPAPAEIMLWADGFRSAQCRSDTEAVRVLALKLATTLQSSAEHKALNMNNGDYIYAIYWAFFLREPDQAGLQFWSTFADRALLVDLFGGCAEFRERAKRVMLGGCVW